MGGLLVIQEEEGIADMSLSVPSEEERKTHVKA